MGQSVWARFAHKSVLGRAHVRPDEVFTVLTDDRMNPVIAEACFNVGLAQTPYTQMVVMRSHHSSEEPVHLNKAAAALLRESDVVLSICQTRVGQIPEVHQALRGGTRFLLAEPEDRTDFLIDGLINLDYDQMVRNASLFGELWQEGGSCRIASREGTDLTFEVGERPVSASEGAVSNPGDLDWYPGAMVSVAPVEPSVNGTVAVDGSVFPFGLVPESLVVEIKDGVIQDVHGGAFAARWKAWLESLNDEVAYQLCHVSFGFNPRAEITGRITEDERAVGALTVGFGRQPAKFEGGVKGGEHHLDIIARSPTLVAGDKTLLEGNVFNPELGFVAL
jgi:leucyl aminopeptidase (aminopeptidase T)